MTEEETIVKAVRDVTRQVRNGMIYSITVNRCTEKDNKRGIRVGWRARAVVKSTLVSEAWEDDDKI